MSDRRNEKTKEALKEAILLLTKKKTLEKVSISELCETANISRSTFYLNYNNISEIISEMKEDFLQGLGFDQINCSFILEDAVKEGRFILDNGDLFLFLVKYGNIREFFVSHVTKLTDVQIKKDFPSLDSTTVNLMTNYIISGSLSILEYCITNNMTDQSDKITELLFKLTDLTFQMAKNDKCFSLDG